MLNWFCLSVSCFVETKGVVFIWSTVSFRQVIRESTHCTKIRAEEQMASRMLALISAA